MFITVVDYDELSLLFKGEELSTNNSELMFGDSIYVIHEYFKNKFKTEGFILGILGKLTPKTVQVLKALDPNALNRKVVVEIDTDLSNALVFKASGVCEVIDSIPRDIPDEDIWNILDSALTKDSKGLRIAALPSLKLVHGRTRVMFQGIEANVDVDGVEVIKLE